MKAKAKVRNAAGIHVRPSGVIYTAFLDTSCEIEISSKGRSTDMKSVVGLIAIGLVRGDVVDVTVSGPDEQDVCSRLVDLLEKQYDFPPKDG